MERCTARDTRFNAVDQCISVHRAGLPWSSCEHYFFLFLQVSKEGAFLCHFTALALLASKDTFVGVVVGLAVAALLFLHEIMKPAEST